MSTITAIWNVISDLGCWILWALQSAFNGLVAALAAAIAAAVGLLPEFPELPDWSEYVDQPIVSMAAWFVPLGFIVTWLGILAGLWLVLQVALVLLRWGKAI